MPATAADAQEVDDRIDTLVRTLIDSRSTFDPARCIDGPLFASVHFIGDTPLWEKIGGSGRVRNVKGQKYVLPDDDGDKKKKKSGTFVNYAEIFGENFYLRASGNCEDVGPTVAAASNDSPNNNNNGLLPMMGALLASLFGPATTTTTGDGGPGERRRRRSSSATLLPTPYDYSATVTGASIVLFRKFSLDLAIEGTGTVRVLYADENLRVFVSPKDTNVTRGGGDWESEGLIVVQVRVDLVYDDWEDRL